MQDEEQLEFEIEEGMSRWQQVLIGLVLVSAVVVLVGGVAHLVGIGFMGYRLVLHGDGDLYVLNLTGEERFVSVEGREAKVIHAQDAQLMELVGGRSQVQIYHQDMTPWREWEVETSRSHVLLNISTESCLAVTDITALYTGQGSVEFSALLPADVEVHVLGSRNIVWPRRNPPPRVDPSYGPALSVEIVGCPLLQEPEFLKEYLLVRIEERMSRTEDE